MSILKRKRASTNEVSAENLEIADYFIHGMIQMVADAHGVISIVAIREEHNSLHIQTVKHLMFLQQGDDVFIVDNHLDNYLSLDEFTKHFAKFIQAKDSSVETMVTLKIFEVCPTDPMSGDGTFESYYWHIEEFATCYNKDSEENSGLPPRINIVGGRIIEENHLEPNPIFNHEFVSFAQDENCYTLNSNDFLAEILSRSLSGLHAFSPLWKEGKDYFFKTSFFQKKEGSLRLIKHDNVMGLLEHNLMMVNLQARINSGKEINVFVQSYNDNQKDQDRSDVYGWEIIDGLLRQLSGEESEALMRKNSAGDITPNINYL